MAKGGRSKAIGGEDWDRGRMRDVGGTHGQEERGREEIFDCCMNLDGKSQP